MMHIASIMRTACITTLRRYRLIGELADATGTGISTSTAIR